MKNSYLINLDWTL